MATLAVGAHARAAGTLTPGSGALAPPLALRAIDGRDVDLAEFRGRTVLVNFWATGCAPCVIEMPSLDRLRERLQPLGLEVLGVNLKENAARIRPFAEERLLGFPIVRDHDGAASAAWNVRVFPTSFVIDSEQRVALVAVGEIDWDRPDTETLVRSIIGSRAAAAPSR